MSSRSRPVAVPPNRRVTKSTRQGRTARTKPARVGRHGYPARMTIGLGRR